MKIDSELVLVVKSDGMADGEQDLRQMLLANFLKNVVDGETAPERILFMGKGVLLTTEGSWAIETLNRLVAAGTKIFSCGTCLEYYSKKEKLVVGEVGNMKAAVEAMISRKKVIQIS